MKNYNLATITVGVHQSFEVTVTEEMLEGFQAITGDYNPLHTDRNFAAERGHKDRVAYGMLTASFYSTLVGVYLPGRNALLHRIRARFRQPVYPGDRLSVTGEVTAVSEGTRSLEIKATVRNQDGVRVSDAIIGAGIHGE